VHFEKEVNGCVEVPVELKISARTVATSPSPGCTLHIRSQRSASVSRRHVDVDKYTADHPSLSRDHVEEGQGRRCHPTNDEKLSVAEVVNSCTSSATRITPPVLRTEPAASSSVGKKHLATSPNISLKLSPNLQSDNELLSLDSLTASHQRPLSTKQTPSWGVDVEQASDSDSYSDVWVPRTSSAAEAVSGIWIVCGQPSTAGNLRSSRTPTVQRFHHAHKMESPDPVFRRRVAGSTPYPAKWCQKDPSDFGGRSSKTVDRQPTAPQRRRAWRAAAVQCRTRHIDSHLTSQQDNKVSVLSQSTSPQRSLTRMGYLSDVDAAVGDGQETPAVELTVDGGPTVGAEVRHLRNIEQIIHVPVSHITTTTAALASSFLERITSFRHGRSSVHDEHQKQEKLIENRARKALRTIAVTFVSFA